MGMVMRRIGVIATDPDPSSIDPFMVPGDPDGGPIGARPWMFDHHRRGGGADANTEVSGRGLAGTDRYEGEGRGRQRDHSKRSDFHNIKLDLVGVVILHFFSQWQFDLSI